MTAPSSSPAGSAAQHDGFPAAGEISWSEPARAAAFRTWLGQVAARHALMADTLRPASADASFRRYFRIDAAHATTFIVMDAPPEKEDCASFVKVAGLLEAAGVKAPKVLEWEPDAGFMLLEDLGRRTLLEKLDPDQPDLARPFFLQAIEQLVRWQLTSRAGVLPAYDEALLRRELALFPDWYVARHRGRTLDAAQSTQLAACFDRIVQQNLQAARVFVHRDFMPRNLILDAGDQLGVLDFQDAVYGPITYDIASLLRDAFLSWEEDFVIDITVRYWERARKAGLAVDDDFGTFYRHVEWMGLQRHLKVAGIFARLTLRDGKPAYLADAPRFIGYIRATAARYRELTPLLRLVDDIEGTAAATGFAFGRV